jgi:hypothetical protein
MAAAPSVQFKPRYITVWEHCPNQTSPIDSGEEASLFGTCCSVVITVGDTGDVDGVSAIVAGEIESQCV